MRCGKAVLHSLNYTAEILKN
jgi:hypothetical protein